MRPKKRKTIDLELQNAKREHFDQSPTAFQTDPHCSAVRSQHTGFPVGCAVGALPTTSYTDFAWTALGLKAFKDQE